MKAVATVLQLTRGLLVLTPAEYDKSEGGLQIKTRKGPSQVTTTFSSPQIFELNDSLKEHPYEKSEELAAFVKRCAESVSMELGDIFLCIEDEDVLISKEYKHAQAKEKLLPTFARVEAENVLHQEVDKYTILNFEYGQQYGRSNKAEDVSASLFAMNTGILTDIRANFEAAGLHIVKIAPPIAGLLYTSKVDMNSATRAIAVISADFASTRLVVLHNGAPVFQQSFSSVLEDIAEMFMLEFGVSKLGAIDLIRQEGLGICNRCNSATTRKQTMTMLDNAAGEILRNLRMVISTMRIDIDQIVLCDTLAKLPNIAAYCRQVGLSAPMENVVNLYSGGAQPPVANQSATQKGFDSTAFVTLNGLLNMPLGEANLLRGNVLADVVKENKSKLGNFVAGGIAGIAALWMIGVGGWWLALQLQQNSDLATLSETKYQKAQKLIDEEAEYTQKLQNLEIDVATLPRTSMKTSEIVTHFFDEIYRQVDSCSNLQFNHSQQQIVTSVVLKDFNTFVDFKYQVMEDGYFDVTDDFSASVTEVAGNTTTKVNAYTGPLTLIVSTDAQEKGAEAFTKELEEYQAKAAEKREKEKASSKSSKSSETSQTSESSSSTSGSPT